MRYSETIRNPVIRAGLRMSRSVNENTSKRFKKGWVAEQRITEWMQFESLQQCLDPQDTSLTVEGLPAPRRAVVLANKP